MTRWVQYPVVLGQVLSEERARRGLSQAAVAAKLGTSQPWVSCVERGVLSVDLVDLALWARSFGLTIGGLLLEVENVIDTLKKRDVHTLYGVWSEPGVLATSHAMTTQLSAEDVGAPLRAERVLNG